MSEFNKSIPTSLPRVPASPAIKPIYHEASKTRRLGNRFAECHQRLEVKKKSLSPSDESASGLSSDVRDCPVWLWRQSSVTVTWQGRQDDVSGLTAVLCAFVHCLLVANSTECWSNKAHAHCLPEHFTLLVHPRGTPTVVQSQSLDLWAVKVMPTICW